MWLKAVLCSFFGLISLVTSKVSCGDDCISANKCAAASTADQAAMAKAFCGITKAEGAKVCCSRLGGSAGKTLTREEKLALFPTECGYINGQRIVGGEPARLNEYPWMAALEFTVAFTNGSKRPQYQCGGSLINSRYVLTAAHCVVPSLTGVRLGELNFLENPDCEVVLNQRKCADSPKDYEIEERIVHPNYTRMGRFNDIALLRLGQAVEYRKFVREICLPITDDLRNKDVGGLVGAVAGWGLTEYNLYPSALRHVELTIYKSEQCDKALQSGNSTQPPSTVSGKLCAAETNKDSCRGDSGGPLMVAGDFQGSHRFIQHGIVSYGPSPCGKGGPGIYVNVAAHMDWILDTVRP